MRWTIETLEQRVNRKYRIYTRIEQGKLRYVFEDKQTGAVVSCPYSKEDYYGTIHELSKV